MTSLRVSNQELVTVRQAMRELHLSRVKFLGGIGLLMVCGRCHKRVSSGAGQVVKRCALGPLGRPLGDKPDRLPLAGSEVPGQGPVT